ncbi:type III secretion system inner rod subunit SctI [Pseudomonas sp.]|uniref:type III secretion system inner rod subunit SctI n=1 Tax=Pseudomonas sp. TaxID=306 RepID=UPI00260A3205|nr:type III secretion system inner rod subunit SctI [Pseudomonas sp.]
MTISQINSLKIPPVDHEQGLVSGPAQADVDLFNSAMQPNTAEATGHFADGVLSALSKQMDSTGKLSEQAQRSMKTASSSTNPMDIVDMSRSLSQYSLQMSLTTKVLSKSAQALDKLTNLQ